MVLSFPSRISAKDVAAALNVSVAYVRKITRDGKLPVLPDGQYGTEDVERLRREMELRSNEAIIEMMRLNREMGLYDDEPNSRRVSKDRALFIPAAHSEAEPPPTHTSSTRDSSNTA